MKKFIVKVNVRIACQCTALAIYAMPGIFVVHTVHLNLFPVWTDSAMAPYQMNQRVYSSVKQTSLAQTPTKISIVFHQSIRFGRPYHHFHSMINSYTTHTHTHFDNNVTAPFLSAHQCVWSGRADGSPINWMKFPPNAHSRAKQCHRIADAKCTSVSVCQIYVCTNVRYVLCVCMGDMLVGCMRYVPFV